MWIMVRKQVFVPTPASFPMEKKPTERMHSPRQPAEGGGELLSSRCSAQFVSAVLTLCIEQSLSCQPKLAQKCLESVQSKPPPFSKNCSSVYCSTLNYERDICMS